MNLIWSVYFHQVRPDMINYFWTPDIIIHDLIKYGPLPSPKRLLFWNPAQKDTKARKILAVTLWKEDIFTVVLTLPNYLRQRRRDYSASFFFSSFTKFQLFLIFTRCNGVSKLSTGIQFVLQTRYIIFDLVPDSICEAHLLLYIILAHFQI